MSLFAKIILVLTLSAIAYQDLRERSVLVLLFLGFPLASSYLFYKYSNLDYYLLSLAINFMLVGFILILLYTYFVVLKKRKFQALLGLGDVLFLWGFAVSFPIISFINFFLFSILFTFVFYLILKRLKTKKHHNTIPLAGAMSLFLLVVYIAHWLGLYPDLYTL